MVYYCYKADGKAYFKAPNEMIFHITQQAGHTDIVFEELTQVIKAQTLLPVGDMSSIPLDLQVGQKLPDSSIDVKMGRMSAEIISEDRAVKEHRLITTPAGAFDAWLVHEKVTTKNVFRTTVAVADTWYVIDIGMVSQVIRDEKGNLLHTQQLTKLTK